jgi:hypothetical protein
MNSFIKRIERDDLKEQKQVRTHTPEDVQKIISKWMTDRSYATGHGTSVVDLLQELEWQVAEREREACAKICEEEQFSVIEDETCEPYNMGCQHSAAAIRARGEK